MPDRGAARKPRWLEVGRFVASVASVLLIGIYVNLLTNITGDRSSLWTSIRHLGEANLLLLIGLLSLLASENIARRALKMEAETFETQYDLMRHHQRRLLHGNLRIVTELVCKTLAVPCNARYFNATHGADGRTYLEQDRELAVLNVRMPREYGFTRIDVDTPHIVMAKAYRTRSPLYEDLPVDHSSWYDTTLASMIEPTQRFVLCCPALRLDPFTGRHDADAPPHGMVVFYSTSEPPAESKESRVEEALDYAAQFAEQMSQLINMLDLTARSRSERSVEQV